MKTSKESGSTKPSRDAGYALNRASPALSDRATPLGGLGGGARANPVGSALARPLAKEHSGTLSN